MKAFWTIIIILIIIGGIWFVKKDNAEAPVITDDAEMASTTDSMPEGAMMEDGTIDVEVGVDVSTGSDVVVVTYSSDGFTPENIEIAVGQTVRFVNESNNRMWVASDVHPTHEDYAGTSLKEHCDDEEDVSFDQCESADKGGVYEFTFNEAGSWDYHNHSRAADGGTVVVK